MKDKNHKMAFQFLKQKPNPRLCLYTPTSNNCQPFESLQESKKLIQTLGVFNLKHSLIRLVYMANFNTKLRNSELYSTLGLLDKLPLEEEESEKPPQVVLLIAYVLEKNIQKNDKLLKKSKTKDGVTIFHGSKAPTLNIRQYIERVFKYSKCSPSCFVVAYIYMDKFIRATTCYLTSLNAHRLFIASVMVATKFIEDV